MDQEIAKYNRERWKLLTRVNAVFTRPLLELTPEEAARSFNIDRLGDVAGKDVLLLGGGGGQQSAAFGVLGARVTVFDLSPEQLARDGLAAATHGFELTRIQGDLQDLRALQADRYDIVDHPYSLNFVPDVTPVFENVSRVLRKDGIYRVAFANPATHGTSPADWNGVGYTLRPVPYEHNAPIDMRDESWVHNEQSGQIPPPREYKHSFASIVNGLVANGLQITAMFDTDAVQPDPDAEPGTWEHFVTYVRPWMVLHTTLAK